MYDQSGWKLITFDAVDRPDFYRTQNSLSYMCAFMHVKLLYYLSSITSIHIYMYRYNVHNEIAIS